VISFDARTPPASAARLQKRRRRSSPPARECRRARGRGRAKSRSKFAYEAAARGERRVHGGFLARLFQCAGQCADRARSIDRRSRDRPGARRIRATPSVYVRRERMIRSPGPGSVRSLVAKLAFSAVILAIFSFSLLSPREALRRPTQGAGGAMRCSKRASLRSCARWRPMQCRFRAGDDRARRERFAERGGWICARHQDGARLLAREATPMHDAHAGRQAIRGPSVLPRSARAG